MPQPYLSEAELHLVRAQEQLQLKLLNLVLFKSTWGAPTEQRTAWFEDQAIV